MQALLMILLSAMQLLNLVQTTPNVTPEFKAYAITVAENAISYAQTELAQSSSTPVFIAPPQTPQPSTVASVPVLPVPISIVGVQKEYRVYGAGCSRVRFQLHVSYDDGSFGAFDVATMTTPFLNQNSVFSAAMEGDRSLVFEYVPQTVYSDEVVTFSSGNLNFSTVIHTDTNPFLDSQRLARAKEQGANLQVVDGKCVNPIYDVRN